MLSKDGTMNSIDNMRTYDALYLRPNIFCMQH